MIDLSFTQDLESIAQRWEEYFFSGVIPKGFRNIAGGSI